MMRRIEIVTDGSAIGNPVPGRWAAVFAYEKQRWAIFGAVCITTAPEMELSAAIQALRSLDGGHHIKLKSDSEYLVRGAWIDMSPLTTAGIHLYFVQGQGAIHRCNLLKREDSNGLA
jgi:ribonuclease HI